MSECDKSGNFEVTADLIAQKLTGWKGAEKFAASKEYTVKDLWSGKEDIVITDFFGISEIKACDSVTIKISPSSLRA